MKNFLMLSTSLTIMAFSAASQASPINFDFTSLGGNNTYLSKSETVNGVTASGYKFSSGQSNPSQAHLYLRNRNNDHGLGVCSEGKSACDNGGGDINELDNAGNFEAIVLDKGAGASKWTNLFVSSLDNNSNASGNDLENGSLFWGDTLNVNDLRTNSFSFSNGDFGPSVEGDVLGLAQAGSFDPTARYVAFAAGDCLPGGCGSDTNNDYLVWKGSVVSTPEPSALAMLGFGLVGFGFMLRRQRSST